MNSFNWLFKIDKHKNRVRIAILFALLVIVVWRTVLYTTSNNDMNVDVSPLDFVGKMMKGNMILIIALPLYLLFANSFTTIQNNDVLIRLHSRQFIWRTEQIAFALSAFIFSFLSVMTTYLLSGMMLNSFTNEWQKPTSEFARMLAEVSPHLSNQSVLYATPSILFIYVIFTTVGFLCIGLVFAIAKYVFKNTAMVFVILVVFVVMNGYATKGGSISAYFTLDYVSFLTPLSILGKFLVTIGVTLLCSFVGQFLLERQDFILISKKGAK